MASSDDGNVAVNTIDNNLSTRWSANGDGQWIRYNLDATAVVKGVKIAWYKGGERKYNFEVQTSLDNEEWTTVINKVSSGTTAAPENYEAFPRTNARYIRIISHGNNINSWIAITELEVYFNEPSNQRLMQGAAIAPTNKVNTTSEFQASDLKAWPNPNKGLFNIQTPVYFLGGQIIIYNGEEKVMMRKTISGTTSEINISHLPKGIYILKLNKNEKVISKKIIKQ